MDMFDLTTDCSAARHDGSGAGPATAAELLAAWNRTAAPYPRDACIHDLFEAAAAASPDAVALAFEDKTLSYRELNSRANRLARRLQGMGVGPDVRVALSIDRSPEMVVAVLAVLKAGGAYLPLDPDAPAARVGVILKDAGAPIVIAQERRVPLLPDHTARLLRIDADWPDIEREPDENVVSGATARSLAYVMYTSGSTGTPKGVMVEHRAVVRLVRAADYVHLDHDEVLLQMAPLAFDASTFEIWGALLNGAKLAMMPPQPPTPADIGAAIVRHGVTTVWLTAGLFHQIVEGSLESLRRVRQLLAGGDVLAVPHARKVIAELRGCRLINGYGPTECTTFSCCCTVDALAVSAPSIPIGRPIANTRAYILDGNGLPVGVGIEGELYIGGDGLARGYLNRPDQTAESFLPDPFWSEPGARMYRTGDLARYMPDGAIEFLGRRDNQVKIRGFRIELDEIVAALVEHPAIGQCAVLAQGDAPDSKRLAAYVKLRSGATPTTLALREFLRQRLPEYMTPSLFLAVTSMPLTQNGKIDRAALAGRCGERLPSGVAYVPPGAGLEQTVATVWKEVLDVDVVGLHENFFDIGGDSLRLTQVHWKLQQATGQQFSVTTLFQYPTIEAFATFLMQHNVAADVARSAPQSGVGAANDRATRQRAALERWRPIRAKGGVHG